MTDDVEFGHVVDLTLGEPSGTELVVDAAIGATTLTVDYAGDFEDVGDLSLNGATLPYTAIAYGALETDPDVITLAAPLAAAAEVDDKVGMMAGGEPVLQWLLHVSLGDGHPVDIPIPFEQRAMWSSVDVSTPIPVLVSSDLESLVEVPGRPPVIDGSFIDPTSTIPGGQAFSLDAPSATEGYPEDYGWWQVDATTGDILGFWRLVGGVWTTQAIVTVEALKANNAIITALTGETVTGTTIQTRTDISNPTSPDTGKRGAKLGTVDGTEGLFVYNESGVPFIKAIPAEGLAVIAGEVKANSITVAPTSAEEGTSLGGVTEITRHGDGSPGVVRLTGYTTPPKSAPTVTAGYDTVQFVDDGHWADRHGWTTDGTNWFTMRRDGSYGHVEKWGAAGNLVATAFFSSLPSGIVYHSGSLYILAKDGSSWGVKKHDPSTLLDVVDQSYWTHADGSTIPAIGVDAATGDLLIAQSRPSDPTVPNRVRIRRYTFDSGANLTAGTYVDTSGAYPHDLSGVTYGTHDLGANRYIFTNQAAAIFRVISSTGTNVDAEEWQSGMGGKVGFTYVNRTATVTTTNASKTVTAASGVLGQTSVGSAISGTGIPAGAVIEKYNSATSVDISIAATASGSITATLTGFKSMDTNGLMRTYTGQDKATLIGDASLTKWVSNDLSTATLHTTQSPRAKITPNKRAKLNVTTSAINTGGANAPDRVRIFVGQGSPTDPGVAAMWKQTDPAVGVTTTTYSSLATSGTTPVTTNGFAASAGTVQQVQLADSSVFLDGIGGPAWRTDWTPTWTGTTNPVLGDGTLIGRYQRVGGNAITFYILLTVGTTTTFGTGSWRFDLPVNEVARRFKFDGVAFDQSAGAHYEAGAIRTGTDNILTICDPTTAGAALRNLSGTVPFTWASGDQLLISGTYEAA